MPKTSAETVVPCFDSVDELRAGLQAKSNFEPVDLYPRDGSGLLGEVEARLAGLAGVDETEVLAYSSGMSAVTDSIDIALGSATKHPPTLACAQETYTQTKRYIEGFLRASGVKIKFFDSGSAEAVKRAINQEPDVIITETVSNYTGVPVLDIDHFLASIRQSDKKPVAVLDNTLPLSTALPLGEELTEDDSILVVESGTKSYTFNSELLGLAYSKNPELLNRLRTYRRTRGSLPSTRSLEHIAEVLPEYRAEFDERNLRLLKNTGDIALRLSAGLDPDIAREFVIAHPALPSHDSHETYARLYPEHGTPVFYIMSSKHDRYNTAEQFWNHPVIRDQARLGQSFGFDHTRIVVDENVGAIRIAGGAETDGQALGEALAEALNSSSGF